MSERHFNGFYCRNCRRHEPDATEVPVGWYRLDRKASGGRAVRLGVYCSAYCLSRAVPAIEAREREKGDEWEAKSGMSTPVRYSGNRGHSEASRESLARMMRQAP